MIFYGVKTMILIKNIDRMHQKNSKSKLIRLIEEERNKRAASNKINSNENNEIEILPNNSSTTNSSRLKAAILKGLSSTRKEAQAQKTLSIVLVVFIVSYFPIFTFITASSLADFIKPQKISTNFNADEIKTAYNYTLNTTYFLTNLNENILSNSTSSFQDFFQTDKIVQTNILDRIFYSTTWIGYNAAAINPLIHLFLNSNFKTALINCFSFKKI